MDGLPFSHVRLILWATAARTKISRVKCGEEILLG